MTTRHRYSTPALLSDYAGGGIGIALTLGPLALVRPATPVALVLGAAAALFLVYFGRTLCRQLTHIELDASGIRVAGSPAGLLGAAIRWEDLRSLRLEYFSTRRDPERRTMDGGWMQLRLRDARHSIRVDSALDGFEDVVRACAREAARHGAELDYATRANLRMLGIELPGAEAG